MNTFENPVILCTEHQLVWSAWQTAQSIPDVFQQDESTSENRQIFDLWWTSQSTANMGRSLVLTCLEAWMHGVQLAAKEPAVNFLKWWMTIVTTGASLTQGSK